MRRIVTLFASVALLAVAAGGPAAADDAVRIDVRRWGVLALDFNSILLRVDVQCPAGLEVLEAFAYVTQGDRESGWGRVPALCDGQAHRVRVTVPILDDPIHARMARATAVLIVTDPATGATWSDEHARDVRIRPSVYVRLGANPTLGPGGDSVVLPVAAACPSHFVPLEAFAYVNQDGNQTAHGALAVRCDGNVHRGYVTLHADEQQPLHAGRARATGYLLVEDPDGELWAGYHHRGVTLRP